MGGIGKCEAELTFSKHKEHWGGLGSLPRYARDFWMPRLVIRVTFRVTIELLWPSMLNMFILFPEN